MQTWNLLRDARNFEQSTSVAQISVFNRLISPPPKRRRVFLHVFIHLYTFTPHLYHILFSRLKCLTWHLIFKAMLKNRGSKQSNIQMNGKIRCHIPTNSLLQTLGFYMNPPHATLDSNIFLCHKSWKNESHNCDYINTFSLRWQSILNTGPTSYCKVLVIKV